MFSPQFTLGTWQFEEEYWGAISTNEAKKIVRRALSLGISRIDSAESYGNGRAEQIVGQSVTDPAISLSTKSVVRLPHQLESHLDRSLRRLNRPAVDTFYIHWPREGLPLKDAVSWMEDEKSRGRIGHIGLSNLVGSNGEHLALLERIDRLQVGYNTIWRADEAALIPAARKAGVEVHAYSPFAQGLLARRFPHDTSSLGHRARTPLFSSPLWERVWRFHNDYHDLCEGAGAPPAATAAIWALDHGMDGVDFGVRSTAQLEDFHDGLKDLAEKNLNDLFRRIDALSNELQTDLPDLPNLFGYTPTPVR